MTYTTRTRRSCNHPLHAVLTLFSCGMWLPVWAVAAVIGRRETTVVSAARPQGWYWNNATGEWYRS